MTSINSSSPSTQIRFNPYPSDCDVNNFFISSSTVRTIMLHNVYKCYTFPTLYRKSDLCIPRHETVQHRSQFLHSCTVSTKSKFIPQGYVPSVHPHSERFHLIPYISTTWSTPYISSTKATSHPARLHFNHLGYITVYISSTKATYIASL